MERKLTFRAGQRHEDKMLKNILLSELSLSRKLITKLKRTPGGIKVNAEEAYVIRRLHAGDTVELLIEEEYETSPHVVAVEGPLCILYEDADILVVDKGPGIPIHPSQNHYENSLGNFVAYYYAQRGEVLVFRPINRLDKNTSGIVLIAKNAHSGHLLHQQTKEGLIQKEYIAIVQGITKPEGVIDAPIGRVSGSTIKREVQEGGKKALTTYIRQDISDNMSCLKIKTKTGRTHQIRVHMAYIGHPLMGDFLYGSEEPQKISRHALHVKHMSFFHPITKEIMHFTSPVPNDMKKLFGKE
jgi:23S rRNA pseudouridine1911/1915/1917 synthase